MRYPRTHKHETRQRIVEAAGLAFREQGVAETGVDDVMRRAGLTHGGFYSHFRDKGELVAEACAAAFGGARVNLDRIAAQRTPGARVRMLIDSYLSTHHRDNRGSGCLIVAVGADMTRMKGSARADYSQSFTEHLERLAQALRLSDNPAENRDRVTHLMSSLVGALLFARAIDDPVRSEALLHMMRSRLRKEFGSEPRAARAVDHATPAHDFLVTGELPNR